MTSGPAAFGVIGIGNVLMGDDAIGPYVIGLLQSRWEWPETVDLIDGGTPGPELAGMLQPYAVVVVVDAIDTGAVPGTLARLGREALTAAALSPARTPHDPGLTAALLQLELLETGPRDITLLGLAPDRTNTETGLSSAARSALPGLLALVLEELARHGISPTPRDPPLPEKIWWEKRA